MTDLTGTFGLITGVANKRSIAWAIAQALARDGARLALTYQGERLLENVEELAAELDRPLLLPCDVTSRRADRGRLFAAIEREFGGLDFLLHGAAFAPREELSRPVRRDHAARASASRSTSAPTRSSRWRAARRR